MHRVVLVLALAAAVFAADSGASTYTPPSLGGNSLFLADFQEDPFEAGVFIKSSDSKFEGQPISLRGHQGEGSIPGDLSMRFNAAAQHYGIVAPLSPAIEVSASDAFVLQYEVQLTEGLDCGGAYLKVVREHEEWDAEELKPTSPYGVMFGPDKCGGTNKVHLILQRQNEVTKEWEEKHLQEAPTVKADKLPHLYTLVIRPDNTYEIFIDAESAKSGSLLEDFDPPINPPEEIDDPEDVKPLDWEDEPQIADPDATKPDDWDEDAPATIVDESATKPEGWLDDAPEFIPDPEAEMPEDWDEEEDGEFEAPMVPNPACETAPGCGEWNPPMIPNPEYKGRWSAPFIDNPDYVGPWAPRKIPNPAYFVDENPSQLPPLVGVAIEIWTMSAGIEFDNILITDNLDAALAYGEQTWRKKHDGIDNATQEARRLAEKAAREQAYEEGGLLDKVNYFVLEGVDQVADNPVPAVVTAVVIVASVVFCCARGGSSAHQSPIVDSDEDEDDAPQGDDGDDDADAEDEEEEEEGDDDEE